MSVSLQRKQLVVKKSHIHGYGVFAAEDIDEGEVIEECYSILTEDLPALKDYTFAVQDKTAVVLGIGSIFNHSIPNRNAAYDFDVEKMAMVYTATKPIRRGEEIFISYGKDWFSSRHASPKQPSLIYRLRSRINSIKILLRGLSVSGLVLLVIFVSRIYLEFHA